jgi:hypothetical protein
MRDDEYSTAKDSKISGVTGTHSKTLCSRVDSPLSLPSFPSSFLGFILGLDTFPTALPQRPMEVS